MPFFPFSLPFPFSAKRPVISNCRRDKCCPGCPQAWVRGAVAPRKCKVFCALAVTVKRSVDQLLFMHYFDNFSSALHFLLGGGDLQCTPADKILATPMGLLDYNER